MGMGNLSNAEGVGGGRHEFKVNYGPGYRIYFGKDGDKNIILIGGGTKRRQSERHRNRKSQVVGLQTTEKEGETKLLGISG